VGQAPGKIKALVYLRSSDTRYWQLGKNSR